MPVHSPSRHCAHNANQADVEQKEERGPFKRFFYRGLEVHKLLDLSHLELVSVVQLAQQVALTR